MTLTFRALRSRLFVQTLGLEIGRVPRLVSKKGNMTNTTRRSESTVRDGQEDGCSVDFEKRRESALNIDEEKTIGLDGAVDTQSRDDEKITSAEQSSHGGLPHAKSLRLSKSKSHRSYGGEDGYTCFNEDDSSPNISSGGTAADEPFLVSWDGGDADPMNPRSMTNARRWAITLIVSASSLCVYVVWFLVICDGWTRRLTIFGPQDLHVVAIY